MNTNFETAFEELILVESGYVNNPYDSGGKTAYGITENLARSYGYEGAMKELPLGEAKSIYKKEFWDPFQLDVISIISYKISFELFESSVNIGKSKVSDYFQRSLNLLNRQEKVYKDIKVDGLIGVKTVSSLNAHMLHRKSDIVLLKMLNCMQGYHYFQLSERRSKDEEFNYGWFANRVSI